jgi:hypothetical protein
MSQENVLNTLPSVLQNLKAKYKLVVEADVATAMVEVKVEGDGTTDNKKLPEFVLSVIDLYDTEDDAQSKHMEVLSYSKDAKILNNLKVDMQFFAMFNAYLSTFLQVQMSDRGLRHVKIDVRQQNPKPIASEVVQEIALHFTGPICTGGLPGTMHCMNAFGTDYYISGDKLKSATDIMLYPAWMVPIVADDKATFEYDMVTTYFNWPSGIETPTVDQEALDSFGPRSENPDGISDVRRR